MDVTGSAVGDDAFVAFVRDHGRSLFAAAYLLTGTGVAAEDLVQETLTALYPVWERVTGADYPVAYVSRALTNRFVSGLRRRAPSVPFDDTQANRVEQDPADPVADRDLVDRLLATLSPRTRAAIVSRYLHDLSDADIAETLECRPGTVRSLISRGMTSLRLEWARLEQASAGQHPEAKA